MEAVVARLRRGAAGGNVRPMISDLLELESLGAEMAQRARAAGVLLIWRAQQRSVRSVVVRAGKPESSTIVSVAGHGAQVVTEDGSTALASRDDLSPEPALELLDDVIGVARGSRALDLERTPIPALEPLRAHRVPCEPADFGRVDLVEVGRRLAELERDIGGRVPGVTLRLSYKADLDAWRVFRSDGADLLFAMPRCSLNVRATSAGGGSRHSVGAGVSDPHPAAPWEAQATNLFLRRAERVARLARELPHAPPFPAGSYPLVIDYALAKGLAHEAFGHACEADSYRSSILARDGRLRSGDRVGADHVSIIDEPLEGDHAWQPFSANGLPRSRAVLVDRGVLAEGLSDPWSAGPGGVRLTGAARAESFQHPPLPRMSNIRIEVREPLPAPGAFEEYGPEQVRDLLAGAGLFERHPRFVFLSGYAGGQVNTATGDFAFHCRAIYDLGPSRVVLHKPAIFSGSMFGALDSIREAFGPLILDAVGQCGKWGQTVPSSGGSHYFLVLDPHPTVRLGGR
jgi:TldD protein